MRKAIVGISMGTIICCCFVVAILFNMQVTKPIVEQEIIVEQKEWTLQPLRDAEPGTNTTGFRSIMLYPHQADATTYYNTNRSNASAYEYADCVNCSMTGETPFNTLFDIVLEMQVSWTDGYNVSAGAWEDEWSRVYYNETGLSISAEQMTEIVIYTNDNERVYAYVLNNSGSGYQFAKGGNYNGSWNHEIYG